MILFHIYKGTNDIVSHLQRDQWYFFTFTMGPMILFYINEGANDIVSH